MFYDRFKQEDVIDRRMKVEFIKSISSAPPKSQAEEDLLAKSINQVEELTAAKRISGTVKESVEKYFLRSGESAGWGLAIAKMDISAVSLFAELWLIDTYAKVRTGFLTSVSTHGTLKLPTPPQFLMPTTQPSMRLASLVAEGRKQGLYYSSYLA